MRSCGIAKYRWNEPPRAQLCPREEWPDGRNRLTSPQRAMSKKKAGARHHQEYSFLRLSLLPNHGLSKVTGQTILDILDAALTGMYGVIGGAVPHDLVSFGENSNTAIIRCKQRDEAKIWAATTVLTQYKGSSFQLQVLESSSSIAVPTDTEE